MNYALLDVPIQSVSLPELVDTYTDGMLVFHNVDTINKARDDEEFRRVCREAELSVCDGQVLRLLVGALWGHMPDKVSGSDFLPAFCLAHARDDTAVYFLGAGPGVAERARSTLNERAGREVVVGAHSPSFSLLEDEDESKAIVDMINESGADTLAVGLGAPRQELWLARHRHQLTHVRRLIAVGATFDFQSGALRRAPRWVSTIGLEWAFRLAMEPKRLWHRYLVEGPKTVAALVRFRLRAMVTRTPRPAAAGSDDVVGRAA